MKKREGSCIEGSQDDADPGSQLEGIASELEHHVSNSFGEDENYEMAIECTEPSLTGREYCKGGPTTTTTNSSSAAAKYLKSTTHTSASRTSSVCSSTATGCMAPSSSLLHPVQSASNKSLYRRVRNSIMGMVVPLGHRRRSSSSKQQSPAHKKQQAQCSLLPKKTTFVFTEEDALRRIVKRILKDCPRMSKINDREDFLVKLIELMDDENSAA
jgi:hypothetical protein